MAISNAGLGLEYTSTDTFYTNVLNDLFLPAMADTIINPNVLMRTIPRDTTHVEGKNVVFPTHVGRNVGVGAISPEGLLPDPGQQQYDRFAFMVRHIYGRVKFSGVALDASRTQIASWLNGLKSEVEGLSVDMARYRQRCYHNDGSGRLAEVAGVAGSVVTVRVHEGVPGSTVDFDATKFFKVGMRVAFIDDPTGAPALLGDASAITAIDRTAQTITVSPAPPVGTTAGDGIVIASTLDSGLSLLDIGWLNEPMGITGIVNDNNPLDGTANGFMGVDATAAANEWHRAHLDGDLANGGTPRTLTMPLMDLLHQTVIERADMIPDMYVCPFGVLRAYAARILTDRRFAGSSEPQAFDGGYTALSYNMTPLIPDRDCYSNRIYALSLAGMRFHVMAEPSWMDLDGSIYHRVPDRDQYQATMYVRETLAHDVRDHNALLLDIAEV